MQWCLITQKLSPLTMVGMMRKALIIHFFSSNNTAKSNNPFVN